MLKELKREDLEGDEEVKMPQMLISSHQKSQSELLDKQEVIMANDEIRFCMK